jgi:hypothetical protein
MKKYHSSCQELLEVKISSHDFEREKRPSLERSEGMPLAIFVE